MSPLVSPWSISCEVVQKKKTTPFLKRMRLNADNCVFQRSMFLESTMSSDALPLMRDLSQVGQSILGKTAN